MIKTTVQKAIQLIIEERAQGVAWEKAKEDKVFVNASSKCSIILELLSESLTTDNQRHLLRELESVWNLAELVMQEYIYRQGLEDSQMVHKELSELGISVTKESLAHCQSGA